ncbi:DUF411 domain-containing protein [Dechloromonas denitrificans]|uniref:DUF411 domain-containing protein n=1 Tax=Dechloromonas denitrificans TaxID=281362 RepID=UPI001CF7F0F6|nr:DUF411 domain-containing protein [Dechloromonas denitrificans]UCV03320.1 DUF411 domain-containing protein [Dechloromonas denitrificans]
MLKTRSLIIALSLFAGINLAQAAERVEVFKSQYCGCCEKWVEHMRKAGFDVVTKDVNDVPAARKLAGMPERFGSCHTAKVGGYVVEGHVPAADVQRLLKEKPKAVGLAAPGMPQGSPGMETSHPQPYETLLVQADGSAKVFAKH